LRTNQVIIIIVEYFKLTSYIKRNNPPPLGSISKLGGIKYYHALKTKVRIGKSYKTSKLILPELIEDFDLVNA
jgi:hypothetical protein